eukprot:364201-Chlamydomonas_euryale.AAC.20
MECGIARTHIHNTSLACFVVKRCQQSATAVTSRNDGAKFSASQGASQPIVGRRALTSPCHAKYVPERCRSEFGRHALSRSVLPESSRRGATA